MSTRWTAVGFTLLLAAGFGWRAPAVEARDPSSRDGAATPADPARPPRGNALPESILAVIGPNRTVTVSDFVRARQRSGSFASPDTITPQAARRFLDRLVDQELVTLAALAAAPAWTPADSLRIRLLRDRLMVRAVLDSMLGEWRSRNPVADGDSADRAAATERAGTALRDEAAGRLAVTFDDGLLERLAAAWRALPRPTSDSSLAAQLRMLQVMPVVPAADSLAVIARSDLEPYRVADLLEAWKRLSPAYRPRVESAEEIRELVLNGLFERMLRREAERTGRDLRDDIARPLERERERIALERYLERTLLEPLRSDSLGARRWFAAHPDEWAIPMRARLLSLAFGDRAAADRMALALRDADEAARLEARSRRLSQGLVVEITAESDSALFAAALRGGVGTVAGPLGAEGIWRVARVLALLPGRPARFEEVRAAVEERWSAIEGERRLDDLCARLRKRTPVTVNSRAVERLGMADPSRVVGTRDRAEP